MKATLHLLVPFSAAVLAAVSVPAAAQDAARAARAVPAPRLADHPAVAVQRLKARQGYDYTAQFYPHPAWLYLLPASPDELAATRLAAAEAAHPGQRGD